MFANKLVVQWLWLCEIFSRGYLKPLETPSQYTPGVAIYHQPFTTLCKLTDNLSLISFKVDSITFSVPLILLTCCWHLVRLRWILAVSCRASVWSCCIDSILCARVSASLQAASTSFFASAACWTAASIAILCSCIWKYNTVYITYVTQQLLSFNLLQQKWVSDASTKSMSSLINHESITLTTISHKAERYHSTPGSSYDESLHHILSLHLPVDRKHLYSISTDLTSIHT